MIHLNPNYKKYRLKLPSEAPSRPCAFCMGFKSRSGNSMVVYEVHCRYEELVADCMLKSKKVRLVVVACF